MSGDRVKYSRRWIDRLQQLPCYRAVVDKLLQGWSLDATADWVMEQPDRGPLSHLKRSSIRNYLNALNIQLKEIAHDCGASQRTLRAQQLNRLAEEFAAGLNRRTKGAGQRAEPTEEEKTAMQKKHLGSIVDGLNAERLLRLMLEYILPHIILMREIEQKTHKPSRSWARAMGILLKAAAILFEIESAQRLINAPVQKPIAIPATRQPEVANRGAIFHK